MDIGAALHALIDSPADHSPTLVFAFVVHWQCASRIPGAASDG